MWVVKQLRWTDGASELVEERVISGPYTTKEAAEATKHHWAWDMPRSHTGDDFTYGVEEA